MKPSYEELEQKLAASQREFRAADATIENLQMQVEKLAAENAGLKAAISSIHQELCGQGFDVAGWHLNGDLEPLDSWFEENNWNPETPATDDFLAELRAQGVDMAACALDDVNQFNYANMLDDLAQKIRKGVQS